jgi:hypothetical protein
MDLTPEQQAQIDAQAANEAARLAKGQKLEAVRLAKEVLIENARSKSVDSREVTATDITTFAATLMAYVDA